MNEQKQTSEQAPALLSQSGFELAQRMATALSKSTLIPKEFQNNIPNCLIALEMAHRMSASPMMVMQNLYIVHGKPAWSSQFIIAAINSMGKFSPLRFEITGEGDRRQCVAWAVELGTKERLESPAISIAMAKSEGWHSRNGSKWQTMPELMLRYRAATFFGRLYAPEVLMGMKEESEIVDIEAAVIPKIERAIIERPKKREKKKDGQREKAETPNADEVTKRLDAGECTWGDLLSLAVAEKWIDSRDEGLDEEKLAALLDMWPRVAEKLDAMKSAAAKPARKEPEDALFR